MTKRKRTPRPKDELKRELIEQLQLLRNSCQAFDNGLEAAGKHIALSLRVLLYQHGQSRSLLDQLGLRNGHFLDSAGPLNRRNLLTECNLVSLRLSNSEGRYIPCVATGEPPVPMREISFVNWWNGPILKDNLGHTFCRRELVQHIADTDGGAHVDPELDEEYMAISRKNSLGWVFRSGDVVKAFEGRPELACMRQIAHELLSTINRFITEFSQYAKPIAPVNIQ